MWGQLLSISESSEESTDCSIEEVPQTPPENSSKKLVTQGTHEKAHYFTLTVGSDTKLGISKIHTNATQSLNSTPCVAEHSVSFSGTSSTFKNETFNASLMKWCSTDAGSRETSACMKHTILETDDEEEKDTTTEECYDGCDEESETARVQFIPNESIEMLHKVPHDLQQPVTAPDHSCFNSEAVKLASKSDRTGPNVSIMKKSTIQDVAIKALKNDPVNSSLLVKSTKNSISSRGDIGRKYKILADSDSDHSLENMPVVTPKPRSTRKPKTKSVTKVFHTTKKGTHSNIEINSDKISASLQQLNLEGKSDAFCGSSDCKDKFLQKDLDAESKIESDKIDSACKDSSSDDDISTYMKRWQGKQKEIVISDESDASSDSFINDDGSDDDDESYYLPNLPKLVLKVESHNDRQSVTEDFLRYKEQDMKIGTNPAKTPVMDSVSDSSESPPSPANCNPSVQNNITLSSDSDEDQHAATGWKTRVPITPLPAITPKPIQRKNLLVCPKTIGPMRNHDKVVYKTNSSQFGTPTLSFLASLSVQPGHDRLHPEAIPYVKNFKKMREDLAKKLYLLFNEKAFDNSLPDNMEISWNVNLTKTGGRCICRGFRMVNDVGITRTAEIELSTKVVDNCERLRCVMIHEMCHAAAWVISGYHAGHGSLWQAWTKKSMMAFPELPVIGRCHKYKIACKYTYKCTKCGSCIRRHSKSLDMSRKVCGRCRGKLELLVTGAGGSTATPRTPGPFALFVKDNYGSVKKTNSAIKHGDVMKLLGEQFKQMKT